MQLKDYLIPNVLKKTKQVVNNENLCMRIRHLKSMDLFEKESKGTCFLWVFMGLDLIISPSFPFPFAVIIIGQLMK